MARIAGVELPRERRIDAGLTQIYGIGWSKSKKIIEEAGVEPDTRVNDLTEDEINRLRVVVESKHRVEGDLRREIQLDIKRLMVCSIYESVQG